VGETYIVSDTSFADALVAGAAAAAARAPILIVSHDGVPAATAQELSRLRPASIVIVGGPFAISEKVTGLIAASTSGTVTTEAGTDRYGTSVAVSQASFPTTAPAVYLASRIFILGGDLVVGSAVDSLTPCTAG